MTGSRVEGPEREFESAWANPRHTAIELPAVDVNTVLEERYDVERPTAFTRATLWDMEVWKAAAPDRYIPTVVAPGSLEVFPGKRLGALEDFTRATDQRLWLRGSEYGRVIERVHLDHAQQRAFFFGVAEFNAPDGRVLRAGREQPVFHVEHSVAGTDDRPLNLWRIVHLTSNFDESMAAKFHEMAQEKYLRIFIEVYLRDDLHCAVERIPG